MLNRPEWLPDDPPPEFERWLTGAQRQERYYLGGKGGKRHQCMERHEVCDAATNPAKISNLHEPMHFELKDALNQGSVEIEHIVMMVRESARKDVFPMKEGGFLYDTIVDYHDEKGRKAIVDKVGQNGSDSSDAYSRIWRIKRVLRIKLFL